MEQKITLTKALIQIILLVAVGLIFVIAITTFRVPALRNIAAAPGSSPLLTNSPYPGPEETQTEVIDPGETQTVAAIVTIKAIIGATEAARTPIPETPIYLPTGVYEDEPVKRSGRLLGLDAQNGWSGFVLGDHYFLYAGALLSDAEQGAIYLVTATSMELFVTSTKHGALRAISEQNDRLTLMAADDTVFYFDLPARQFVASLTAVAPSLTPSPPEPTGLPYPLPTTTNTAIP